MTFSDQELKRMRIQRVIDQARAQSLEVDALLAEEAPELSPAERNRVLTSYEAVSLPVWFPLEPDGDVDGTPIFKPLPQLLEWLENPDDEVAVQTTLSPLLLTYLLGWRDALRTRDWAQQEP